MQFSIIINSHNQNQFLERCINSILNQSLIDQYEIVLADTSDKKNYELKNKFKKLKNIKFLFLNSQYSEPTQDQLYKIKSALNLCTGNYICLIDGDDFFLRNKLSEINNLLRKEKIFFAGIDIIGNLFDGGAQRVAVILSEKFIQMGHEVFIATNLKI